MPIGFRRHSRSNEPSVPSKYHGLTRLVGIGAVLFSTSALLVSLGTPMAAAAHRVASGPNRRPPTQSHSLLIRFGKQGKAPTRAEYLKTHELTAAATAPALTVSGILGRALNSQSGEADATSAGWYISNGTPPYNQNGTWLNSTTYWTSGGSNPGGWREDCSGFVSQAWNYPSPGFTVGSDGTFNANNYAGWSFQYQGIGAVGSWPQLQPGDAITFNQHVVLVAAVNGDPNNGGSFDLVQEADTALGTIYGNYTESTLVSYIGTPIYLVQDPGLQNTPGTFGTPVASGTSSTTTQVSWGASSGATGYDVTRWWIVNGVLGATAIATDANETSLADSGLVPGGTYAYAVRADNASGSTPWEASNRVTLLAAPTGDATSAIGSTETQVSWGASSGATGYDIDRWSIVNGSWAITPIATDVNETSLVDGGLVPGAQYAYAIRADNASAVSSWSGTNWTTTPTASAIARAVGTSGYDVMSASGHTYAYGSAAYEGGPYANLQSGWHIVGIATTPDGKGYVAVSNVGDAYAYGDATYHGNAVMPSGMSAVGIAGTADGGGYWIVSNTGAVYSFGDAVYHGNAVMPSGMSAVGIGSDPAGSGYWIVSNTGSVYSFGVSGYHGNAALPAGWSAAGIASTGDGGGYWILANSGAIYAFGDAVYEGGTTSIA